MGIYGAVEEVTIDILNDTMYQGIADWYTGNLEPSLYDIYLVSMNLTNWYRAIRGVITIIVEDDYSDWNIGLKLVLPDGSPGFLDLNEIGVFVKDEIRIPDGTLECNPTQEVYTFIRVVLY